jgi:hypothetical protein
MNVAQYIFAIILKMMNLNLFKSGLTNEESLLIQKIKTSSCFKTLKLGKTFDKQYFLTWESAIDRTVACYITDVGIFFSGIELYKPSTNDMKGDLEKNFKDPIERAEKQAILNDEINQLKTIFMSYSIDVEVYFK